MPGTACSFNLFAPRKFALRYLGFRGSRGVVYFREVCIRRGDVERIHRLVFDFYVFEVQSVICGQIPVHAAETRRIVIIRMHGECHGIPRIRIQFKRSVSVFVVIRNFRLIEFIAVSNAALGRIVPVYGNRPFTIADNAVAKLRNKVERAVRRIISFHRNVVYKVHFAVFGDGYAFQHLIVFQIAAGKLKPRARKLVGARELFAVLDGCRGNRACGGERNKAVRFVIPFDRKLLSAVYGRCRGR